MVITKEQVIDCIKNFINISTKIDLVRCFCLEKGKDALMTEVFLQGIRDVNTKNQMEYLQGKIPHELPNIFDLLAIYIIKLKVVELNITYVYNREGKLIHIY